MCNAFIHYEHVANEHQPNHLTVIMYYIFPLAILTVTQRSRHEKVPQRHVPVQKILAVQMPQPRGAALDEAEFAGEGQRRTGGPPGRNEVQQGAAFA